MQNDFTNYQWNTNPFFTPDYFYRKEAEKKKLRRLGLYTGGAILATVFVQNAIVLFLQLFNLTDRYYSDAYFSSAVDIIITVAGMLVPFAIFGIKLREISGEAQPVALSRPQKKAPVLAAIIAGVGFCIAGNIVNSYISMFFSNMDVEFSSPEISMAEGVGGIILTFFRVAVTAAIVEELSFRGFVMGNLRFYGDGFAIAVSSFIFAAVHGNMVQAPFALMAGFALGYFSVKTGTLWTGVIIHALNNALSVIVYYLSEHYGQENMAIAYTLFIYATIAAGMLCFAYFQSKTRHIRLSAGQSILNTKEKVSAFFLNATMIVTIIYVIYVTANYISVRS